MKPGQLFKHKKFDFEVRYGLVNINNKILVDYWSRRALAAEVVMFLEPLDFSKETSVITVDSAWAASTRLGTVLPVVAPSAAKQEFEKTKKIPGGIFLNGDGRKIWISHYDQKELLKES